jgi:acetoin utilization deacetylase AcuC-like enzyme
VSKIIQKFERARYVSIHQSPAFPYMGTKFEILGEHSNVMTIPIQAETSWTCGYRQKFEQDVLPFICSDDDSWSPDLLLICAGYDALDSEELASVSLQAKDYKEMTSKLVAYLQEKGQISSIAFGLEGGYQLSEMAGGGNVADAVSSTIQALIEAKREKQVN